MSAPWAVCLAVAVLALTAVVGAEPGVDWADHHARLDVNSAPGWQLEMLPQIGSRLASRMIEARADRPFQAMADLRRRVRGIGPTVSEQIAEYVRFDPPPTETPP